MKKRISLLVLTAVLVTIVSYGTTEERACIAPPNDRNCNGIPDWMEIDNEESKEYKEILLIQE